MTWNMVVDDKVTAEMLARRLGHDEETTAFVFSVMQLDYPLAWSSLCAHHFTTYPGHLTI